MWFVWLVASACSVATAFQPPSGPFPAPPSLQESLKVSPIYPPFMVFPLTVKEPMVQGQPAGTEDVPTRSYFVAVNVSGQPLDLLLDLRYGAITVLRNDYCANEGVGGPCFDPSRSRSFYDFSPSQGHVQLNSPTDETGAGSGCNDIRLHYAQDVVQLPGRLPDTAYFYMGIPMGFTDPPETWRNGSGRMGLARPSQSLAIAYVATILQEQPQPLNPWVVLDLNGFSDTPSTVQFGGSFNQEQQPIWSEINPNPGCSPETLSGYFVNVFHFGTCGVDLIESNGNYATSALLAVLDLDEPCLVVPASVFRSLTIWLPLACNTSAVADLRCTLNTTIVYDNSTLPPITFQLSENGPLLQIPLQNLFLADGRICLRSFEDLASIASESVLHWPTAGANDLFFDNPATIIFGTRVLESFQVVLDWGTNRTGLIPKANASLFSNQFCNASLASTCYGIKVYTPAVNDCVPKDCTVYLFLQYDPDTAECTPAPAFKAVVLAFCCLLAFFDIFQASRYYSLIRRLFRQPEARP